MTDQKELTFKLLDERPSSRRARPLIRQVVVTVLGVLECPTRSPQQPPKPWQTLQFIIVIRFWGIWILRIRQKEAFHPDLFLTGWPNFFALSSCCLCVHVLARAPRSWIQCPSGCLE